MALQGEVEATDTSQKVLGRDKDLTQPRTVRTMVVPILFALVYQAQMFGVYLMSKLLHGCQCTVNVV